MMSVDFMPHLAPSGEVFRDGCDNLVLEHYAPKGTKKSVV